jgi:tetratricopeptide (TPR) repeat protein
VGSRGWALTDPEAGPGRILARSRTALVGRHTERAQCRAAAADAADGHPRVLLVTGEVGVGKSRLLEELERDATQRGMRTVSVCCYAGAAEDFAPLRRIGPLTAGDGELLIGGDTLTAQAVGVAQAIIADARREPLAISLDDLDEGDPGTLLVVRYLARWCRQHSISAGVSLLVAGALDDPKLLGPEAIESDGEEAVAVVALAPLGPLESVELVKELALGDAPRVVSEAVAERCEGNPLVARVITDLLLADSRVGPGAVDTQLVGADTAVWRLPRSPDDAIERQFESLDRQTRRILASAAALNGDGPVQLVSTLAGEEREVVDASLATAQELGIVEVGASVAFTHPLARERALAELTLDEVEDLHARICRLLIEAGYEESPAVVEHLRRAGSAVDVKLVFSTSVAIGRAAAARGQWSTAVRGLQLAATVARRLPEVSSVAQGALWRETGDALLAAGEVREARRWIERAAELFDAASEPTGRASATVAAARCGVWAGSFGDHIDLRPVAAIATDDTLPPSVRAEAQLVASELAWMSGDAAGSLTWSGQAVDRATAIDEPGLAAEALVSSATGHWLQLGLEDALGDLDRAAALADAASSDGATALVAGRRALTCWWLGRVDDASEAAERGLAAADRANLPLERALPLAASAAIAAMRGDRDAAIRGTAEADLLCSLSGDHWAAAFIYPSAAANAVWQGDLDEAEAHLARWDESLDGVDHGRRHLVHVMIDTTRRYLAVVGGDRSQAAWFTSMAPTRIDVGDVSANVGSATFFALMVEAAARLGLPEVAAAALPYVDDAQRRGQRITSGWPALLPRVGAVAARLAGDAGGAVVRARDALTFAAEHDLVVEQVLGHQELARCLAAADPDGDRSAVGAQFEAAATLAGARSLTACIDNLNSSAP